MFGLKQRFEKYVLRIVARGRVATKLEHWGLHSGEGAPGEAVFGNSAPCREEDFRQPWFSYWTQRMHAHLSLHRKLWEFVFICQSLHERGFLGQGRRGLGFGVGGEQLPALFAAMGCEILATDIASEDSASAGWAATAQHAASKDGLRRPAICPDEVFERSVSFASCDMNAVPEALTGFDFCWSACALEHLGSIERGLAFIERSLDCLKPGGLAIHTTEYNVSSNTGTVDNLGTVLFRRQDIERLAARLTAAGHEVAPLNFDPGHGVIDNYVDLPPYRAEPHLKLALMGYVTTSYGIIVRKRG